jgi:hypothetical protein
MEIHGYLCCMRSRLVLLKHLRKLPVIMAYQQQWLYQWLQRLPKWNTRIYWSWAGVVVCGLPLIERSRADPVWFNLRQRREIVLRWTFNCRTTWVWYCPDQWRPMTFRAAGSNLSIAVFHSSNDNSLFHTQGLYCVNRFFCVMTATLILHVFKNTLDELPDCSYRHFVFSIHIYSLLKYLII